MMNIAQYTDSLVARGKCNFTLVEAQQALGKSRAATILSIEHLRHQGKVATPAKGFYVIVMPEYRRYGCLPAEYFIPHLMQSWNEPYYVCLVSAAAYHGASHQQSQVFQVMLSRNRKPISCSQVKVRFFKKSGIEQTPTQHISTRYSRLVVSTPEATAVDLVNYMNQSGGLNRVVTILDELQESMRPEELTKLAISDSKDFWKQRLGYLLEKLGANELAESIYQILQQKKGMRTVLLDPSYRAESREIYNKNSRWKIIENSSFESDL
jgi:predicted transcriptional regulator of viral defense system